MRKATGRRHVANSFDIASYYANLERIAREEAERMARLEGEERRTEDTAA